MLRRTAHKHGSSQAVVPRNKFSLANADPPPSSTLAKEALATSSLSADMDMTRVESSRPRCKKTRRKIVYDTNYITMRSGSSWHPSWKNPAFVHLHRVPHSLRLADPRIGFKLPLKNVLVHSCNHTVSLQRHRSRNQNDTAWSVCLFCPSFIREPRLFSAKSFFDGSNSATVARNHLSRAIPGRGSVAQCCRTGASDTAR